MSRVRLRQWLGQKLKFRATVANFGYNKKGNKGYKHTVVLTDVMDVMSKEILADHVWVNLGKRMDADNIDRGDIITFYAVVKEYYKGGKKYYLDYRLSHPSEVKVVNRDKRLTRVRYSEQEQSTPFIPPKIISKPME